MRMLSEHLETRGLRWNSGAAVVEFVLILSLISVLLFGSIEYVVLLNNRLTLESAARDGARRAGIAGGDTAYVRERIAKQLELGNISPDRVEVAINPWSAPYGHSIRVRLTYVSPTVTPVGKALVGGSVTLSTEVLTRSERVK